MKVFLDTNVIVAACVLEHDHHERAFPLMEMVHIGRAEGFLSAHSLLEIFSVLTRLPRSPRLLPIQAAQILSENVLKYFTDIGLSGREYGELVQRCGKDGIVGGEVYDALHLECARKSGAERIFTFNLRHFQSIADEKIRARICAP